MEMEMEMEMAMVLLDIGILETRVLSITTNFKIMCGIALHLTQNVDLQKIAIVGDGDDGEWDGVTYDDGGIATSSGESCHRHHHPHPHTHTHSHRLVDVDELLRCGTFNAANIAAIRARGPDCLNAVSLRKSLMKMVASTLYIRGHHALQQPIISTDNNVFAFNGEVFGGDLHVKPGTNDAEIIMNSLENCRNPREVWNGVQGPFAFMFWHEKSSTLWFGRDHLGRRSLLISSQHSSLRISSVALHRQDELHHHHHPTTSHLKPPSLHMWTELPCLGLYALKFTPRAREGDSGGDGDGDGYDVSLLLYPWPHIKQSLNQSIYSLKELSELDIHPVRVFKSHVFHHTNLYTVIILAHHLYIHNHMFF